MPWSLLAPLLAPVVGPFLTQGAKALAVEFGWRLPSWSKPLVHAGIQVGGALAGTYLGVNPFGEGAHAALEQAFVGQALGTAAYERWRSRRPAATPRRQGNPWG